MADFSQRVKVSTQGIAFFNEEKAMLKIVYLEDAVTVSINYPLITDGKTTYPQEMRHSVLINQNNVAALVKLICEVIIPSYEKGENKDAGVFTNRARTQMFEVLEKGGTFFAVIHDEIENRIPKNTYIFKFDKTMTIQDYDTEALSFNSEELDAQFYVFCKVLESFMLLGNGVTAHEYQYRQSYFIDQVRRLITALDTRFNLGIGYKRTSDGTNNYGNSGFGTPPETTQVHETSMDNLMNSIMPGSDDQLPFV